MTNAYKEWHPCRIWAQLTKFQWHSLTSTVISKPLRQFNFFLTRIHTLLTAVNNYLHNLPQNTSFQMCKTWILFLSVVPATSIETNRHNDTVTTILNICVYEQSGLVPLSNIFQLIAKYADEWAMLITKASSLWYTALQHDSASIW